MGGGGEGPINLDWQKLLDGEDGEPPQVVLVVAKSSTSDALLMDLQEYNQTNDLQSLPDNDLESALSRFKNNYKNLSTRLTDGGEKYMISMKQHQAEWERRQLLRSQKNVIDGCKKPIELQNHNCIGVSDDVRHQVPSAPSSTQSVFASCFRNKLEGKTASTTANAFENELSTLNRCNSLKMDSDKQFFRGGRQKRGLSSRESPFRSPGSPLLNFDNEPLSNGDHKDRNSTASHPSEEDMHDLFGTRKTALRGQTSNCLKRMKGETVVLVDEEEPEVEEETTAEASEVHECFSRNSRIFYPSRNDPSSVEICYSDMDCLAPEAYLSSTIINFYIRYLQVQGLTSKMTNSERYNYHFFNTYFYEKLKEAVTRKSINENSFAKFRRWWKGVNIFEKAYIFLPIHENLHWSLAIVCIPDKEDRLGPILLHLDSLGLHSSSSIFGNIKSFLKEEWKFLNGDTPLDLPIADTIWENLPRRIDEKIVEVPQQRNDYDCGLFVLFFMKRFIEQAPQRLKKKDLPRFGRNWFKPEEASSLRQDIQSLLKEKFKTSSEETQVLYL